MTRENRIRVMGILNVTPDSFSDGGQFATFDSALAQAQKLIDDGADILDIGGESTRPFADPVSTEEELQRVIPVIKAVRDSCSIPISIDTSKARVAREALNAGADIINDVWALRRDPEMIEVALESDVPFIIMHMKGTPTDMQTKPSYENVVTEIIGFLRERLDWITGRGVDLNRLIVDPGIGFGKNLQHNLSILKHLDEFSSLGSPVLLGHSRKRFLGDITGMTTEIERDLATAVVTGLCASKKIDIIRVHDVAATRQALKVAKAMQSAA